MSLLFAELADDAATLARLHDRALDAETLAALKDIGFPDNLALLPQSEEAREAWRAMRQALAPLSPGSLDALSGDFTAIYLLGTEGISPCESVWLSDERLTHQAPMFALRDLYRDAGLAAENWRLRPDDHLVLQLLYIAHRLRHDGSCASAVAAMMDAHLLRWLPAFAHRIAARGSAPFHAASASLTLCWCLSLRAVLGGDGAA